MLETLLTLTLLVAFIVPGYIFHRVRRRFFLTDKDAAIEETLISYAVTGLAITALTWPLMGAFGHNPIALMISATNGQGLVVALQREPLPWIIQLFILPALLAVVVVYVSRLAVLSTLQRKLRLLPLAKQPSAVDQMVKFMRDVRPHVEVLLKDRTRVYGQMGDQAAVSVETGYPDLFIHPLYRVDENGEWVRTQANGAVFIRGSEIRSIIMYDGAHKPQEG